MLALLSPAKKLDFDAFSKPLSATRPLLIRETEELMKTVRQLSASDLARLMKLSPALAELNFERFQRFSLSRRVRTNTKQAALAFNGDTYVGLQAPQFETEDFAFAQEHLAILSGLYGLLRPLDLIQPYRLEMGTRLRTPRGANLYEFWGDKIAKAVNKQLKCLSAPWVVNLASSEYYSAVAPAALKANVITCVFKERRGGQSAVIGVFAKRARGMMARFIVQQRLEDPKGLRDFDASGYRFERRASTERELVFVRDRTDS